MRHSPMVFCFVSLDPERCAGAWVDPTAELVEAARCEK